MQLSIFRHRSIIRAKPIREAARNNAVAFRFSLKTILPGARDFVLSCSGAFHANERSSFAVSIRLKALVSAANSIARKTRAKHVAGKRAHRTECARAIARDYRTIDVNRR